MKILYLHQYFKTPRMCGGTRSYEMARRLVLRGHEVHMITSDREASRKTRGWVVTEESGIHVHWIPVPYSNEMTYFRRIKSFLRFAYAAAHRAASIEADVVFATSTPLTIALPGVFASRKQRIPMVFEVRDLWPEVPIEMGIIRSPATICAARRLERCAYHYSEKLVALSPRMKEGIVRQQVSAARVTVIPNGCDFDMFDVPSHVGQQFRRRRPWLRDRPFVVYIGTMGRANDVEYLVRMAALARRRNHGVRFAAVGSGSQTSHVRALAHELGVLDQNFFLLERLPKSEIPGILSAADMATDLKTVWADSANKFFDALAARRPIAIHAQYGGWLTDLIRTRNIGILTDPASVELSTEKLLAHVEDRPWLKEAGERANETGRQLFDRNRLAGQLEDVLHDAVSQSVGPRQGVTAELLRKPA